MIKDNDLWQAEITRAHEYRARRTAQLADMVDSYAGSAYRDGNPDLVINAHQQQLSDFLPAVCGSAPEPEVLCAHGDGGRAIAKSHTAGLRRWVRRSRLLQRQETLATDQYFGWSVGLVRLAFDDMTGGLCVEHSRIDPMAYLQDAAATDPESISWAGHEYMTSKERLLVVAKKENEIDKENRRTVGKWIVENIEKASAEARMLGDNGQDGTLARDELCVLEVWDREYEWTDRELELEADPDADEQEADGERQDDAARAIRRMIHGAIRTFVKSQDKTATVITEIRTPRPYHGPPEGPYVVSGSYYVPRENLPLSVAVLNASRAARYDRVACTIWNNAEKYTRMVGVRTDDESVINTMRTGDHNGIVKLGAGERNAAAMVEDIEIGGTTNEMLVMLRMAQEQSDRGAATSDADSGTVTGAGTATEVATAQEASQRRRVYPVHKFGMAIEETLRRVLWFHHNTAGISFAVGEDEDGNTLWFRGGQNTYQAEDGSTVRVSLEDLDITLNVRSMGYEDESTRFARGQAQSQWILNLGQAMLQNPHIRWSRVMPAMGSMLQIPGLEEYFAYDVAGEMVQAQIDSADTDGAATAAGPKPTGGLFGTDQTRPAISPGARSQGSTSQRAQAEPERMGLGRQRASRGGV